MFLEIGFRKQLTKSLKSPCGEVSLLVILKAWKRVTLLQTNCFIRDLQRIQIKNTFILQSILHGCFYNRNKVARQTLIKSKYQM